jgi:hypothetical protein
MKQRSKERKSICGTTHCGCLNRFSFCLESKDFIRVEFGEYVLYERASGFANRADRIG